MGRKAKKQPLLDLPEPDSDPCTDEFTDDELYDEEDEEMWETDDEGASSETSSTQLETVLEAEEEEEGEGLEEDAGCGSDAGEQEQQEQAGPPAAESVYEQSANVHARSPRRKQRRREPRPVPGPGPQHQQGAEHSDGAMSGQEEAEERGMSPQITAGISAVPHWTSVLTTLEDRSPLEEEASDATDSGGDGTASEQEEKVEEEEVSELGTDDDNDSIPALIDESSAPRRSARRYASTASGYLTSPEASTALRLSTASGPRAVAGAQSQRGFPRPTLVPIPDVPPLIASFSTLTHEVLHSSAAPSHRSGGRGSFSPAAANTAAAGAHGMQGTQTAGAASAGIQAPAPPSPSPSAGAGGSSRYSSANSLPDLVREEDSEAEEEQQEAMDILMDAWHAANSIYQAGAAATPGPTEQPSIMVPIFVAPPSGGSGISHSTQPGGQSGEESDEEEVPPLVNEATSPRPYPTPQTQRPAQGASASLQQPQPQRTQRQVPQQSAGTALQGTAGHETGAGVVAPQQQRGYQQQQQQGPPRLQLPPPPLQPPSLAGYSPGASTMAPSPGSDDDLDEDGEYETGTSTAWTPASSTSLTHRSVTAAPSTSTALATATETAAGLPNSSSGSGKAVTSEAGAGSQGSNSSSSDAGLEECWVCFTAGPLPPQHEGDTAGHIFQPCTVCTGGLRHMHRSCMQRWLASSWSVACPNCARPYASTVLEEFPEGRILLQLVDACVAQRLQLWGDAGAAQAAALMGDTSNRSQVLRERFAFGTRVRFTVQRELDISLHVGEHTISDVMRSVRNLLDSLSGADGSPPYQLPNGRYLCQPGDRLSNDAVNGLQIMSPTSLYHPFHPSARGGPGGGGTGWFEGSDGDYDYDEHGYPEVEDDDEEDNNEDEAEALMWGMRRNVEEDAYTRHMSLMDVMGMGGGILAGPPGGAGGRPRQQDSNVPAARRTGSAGGGSGGGDYHRAWRDDRMQGGNAAAGAGAEGQQQQRSYTGLMNAYLRQSSFSSGRRFFDQQQPGSGPHLRAQQVAQTWLELAGDLTQRMLRPAFDVGEEPEGGGMRPQWYAQLPAAQQAPARGPPVPAPRIAAQQAETRERRRAEAQSRQHQHQQQQQAARHQQRHMTGRAGGNGGRRR